MSIFNQSLPGTAKLVVFLGDYLVLTRFGKEHPFTGVSLELHTKPALKSQLIVSTKFTYDTTWSK